MGGGRGGRVRRGHRPRAPGAANRELSHICRIPWGTPMRGSSPRVTYTRWYFTTNSPIATAMPSPPSRPLRQLRRKATAKPFSPARGPSPWRHDVWSCFHQPSHACAPPCHGLCVPSCAPLCSVHAALEGPCDGLVLADYVDHRPPPRQRVPVHP